MANHNLLNNVIAVATRMSAELGTSKTQFTLEHVEIVRHKVRKDHWNMLVELERSDDTGRIVANSVIRNLFLLAFNNVRSARIFDPNTLEIIFDNGSMLRIDNPAQREQEK